MTKRILWLHSDFQGCGAYRAYTPAMGLEGLGYESMLLWHAKALTGNRAGELADVDIVVFQRAFDEGFKPWVHECQRRGIVTVAELDDDLFHIPRSNPSHAYWSSHGHMAKWFLAHTDHTIVSTRPLAQTVQHSMGWRTAERITVCMNHLHPAIWGPQVWQDMEPYPNNGKTVIGWQGSITHDVDFKEALPALKRILEDFPEVICRFFGSVPMSVKGVIPPERFQWSKGVEFSHYPRFLRYQNFDIGIAPITDSKFNACKSHIKWMEYGVYEIPCVASRVYPYAKAIRHGETGFLASTTQEWYDALRLLVTDRERRAAVGRAAREEAWRTFGGSHANSWREALGKAEAYANYPQLSRAGRAAYASAVGTSQVGAVRGVGEGEGSFR